MSDSIAKPRATRSVPSVAFVPPALLIAGALPMLLAGCATGSGSPAPFSTEVPAPSYDAAPSGPPSATAAGDSADDGEYGPAGAEACVASWEDASADAEDGGAADADDGGSIALPAVGDIVITEIMFDPSGPVPEAQWFELYNLTATPQLLTGLTIEDGWGDSQGIESGVPVIAPPFTYVVLVRDLATAVSSGIPDGSIVYEYGAGLPSDQGIELASDATGDVSLWSGGLELVDVPYGRWSMAFPGQSIELGPLQYAGADDPANWCVGQLPWAAGSDDGTPGFASDCL
jgi:hypothetical protein